MRLRHKRRLRALYRGGETHYWRLRRRWRFLSRRGPRGVPAAAVGQPAVSGALVPLGRAAGRTRYLSPAQVPVPVSTFRYRWDSKAEVWVARYRRPGGEDGWTQAATVSGARLAALSALRLLRRWYSRRRAARRH